MYLILLSVKQGGIKYIFKVFGMTRPGIEPRSPGSLANTLPTGPVRVNKQTWYEKWRTHCFVKTIIKKKIPNINTYLQTLISMVFIFIRLNSRGGDVSTKDWNQYYMAQLAIILVIDTQYTMSLKDTKKFLKYIIFFILNSFFLGWSNNFGIKRSPRIFLEWNVLLKFKCIIFLQISCEIVPSLKNLKAKPPHCNKNGYLKR